MPRGSPGRADERTAMEFRQVETFRAVAEELSFSRAAAKLGYVQSSVSSQVAALEQELGAPLFDRLGRKILLTEAGRVMLSYSEGLLDLAEEARERVSEAGVGSGEVTGALAISAPETLLTYRLPRLLAEFHRRYPKVRLSVRPSVIGRLTGEARRAVEEGRVDLAFVLDEEIGDAPGIPRLTVEPLAEEEVAVVAPTAHALVGSSSLGPKDLAGETMLLPEAPEAGCAYRRIFERQLARERVVPPETMEFASIEAVKQCVAAGMGVSVLPTVAVGAELEADKLAALDWGEPFRVETQLVYHAERWKSPAFRAFLNVGREIFRIGND